MLNIVTVYAIRKTSNSSLSKPLKTLLLSLVVSDVCVGLFGEPFYIVILVKWSQVNNPSCMTYLAFLNVINLFLLASFCGVVAISVDRFLAIYLHLRYQELVTHKRVVVVVIAIWLFCAYISSTRFWLTSGISSQLFSIIGIVCILLTTVVYCKIYLVLRRHKNQIQAIQIQNVQQTAQNGNMANFASLKKSAVGLFYVYLLFLFCYVPRGIYFITKKFNGPNTTSKSLSVYSLTLLFLNSLLNPVIYCWKMRHIRHSVLNILRNIIRINRNANLVSSHLDLSFTKN